jgi:hypothetical protein
MLEGKKVLIVGEVGSGKTALTARLLREAIVAIGPAKITAIDMAPRRKQFKRVVVGGRLTDFMRGDAEMRILVPAGKLHAPRIEGKTANEVVYLARVNAQLIQELLEAYLMAPTPILFINDVSMYLLAGEVKPLLKVVKLAETFVANSYEGLTLGQNHDSGISKREKSGLSLLKKAMDYVVPMSATASSPFEPASAV